MSDETNGASAYPRALALGAVCGLRTMMGPAVLAGTASAPVKLLLRALSAGEMIVDKLPKTPNRIAPGPLAARALSGAIVGAIVCRGAQKSPWLGGAGALAGTVGGFHARRALARRLPDPVVAVAEDALAIAVGRHFAR